MTIKDSTSQTTRWGLQRRDWVPMAILCLAFCSAFLVSGIWFGQVIMAAAGGFGVGVSVMILCLEMREWENQRD